jgi:hypothetical protein
VKSRDPLPALQLVPHSSDAAHYAAMAAGLRDHVWSMEELIGLLDAAQKKAA